MRGLIQTAQLALLAALVDSLAGEDLSASSCIRWTVSTHISRYRARSQQIACLKAAHSGGMMCDLLEGRPIKIFEIATPQLKRFAGTWKYMSLRLSEYTSYLATYASARLAA